jgi:signal transduction histidine kinase
VVAVALLAPPLLVAEGPVTVGPVTVEHTWQAWSAFGIGLLAMTAWAATCTGLARVHAVAAATMLGPRGAALRAQVSDLTRSRRRLVDSFDGERRRIERDLHDGVQQHLVALGMTLDLARLELRDDPRGQAAELVERAHAQALSTLRELRDLVQGIHPPVLTQLGLPAAVRELVDRSGLPVTIGIDLPDRAAAAVETAAYFVVAEALTNAARHSRATAVRVRLTQSGDRVLIEVRDNGTGGAEPRPASGLSGLADRVMALGGQLTLSSPTGGPTVLTARLPAAGRTGPVRA